MPTRHLIGLAVGSGFDAAEAAAVRIDGAGLAMTARVEATVRLPMPAEPRDAGRHLMRQPDPWPADLGRRLGETLAAAARESAARAGLDLRSVLAAGLL